MKLSTLLAATVLATAGFGAAAHAQQAGTPTNPPAPITSSEENNLETLERDQVAAQPGAATTAPSTSPECQQQGVSQNETTVQACEEASRAAVAAGTSAAGETVGPNGSTDPVTTSAVPGNVNAGEAPLTSSEENNAETLQRDQVAQ